MHAVVSVAYSTIDVNGISLPLITAAFTINDQPTTQSVRFASSGTNDNPIVDSTTWNSFNFLHIFPRLSGSDEKSSRLYKLAIYDKVKRPTNMLNMRVTNE